MSSAQLTLVCIRRQEVSDSNPSSLVVLQNLKKIIDKTIYTKFITKRKYFIM